MHEEVKEVVVRDLEVLNADLKDIFGWRVEVAPQRSKYEAPGFHLKLYRIANPLQPGSKDLYRKRLAVSSRRRR